MDLILVIIIFIILICVIKTREYFYNDPAVWNGHSHKHANDHHTPNNQTHITLPIADPTFKYEERKMICELLPHKTQCEHYGCEWDTDNSICRNPIKGNEKICTHVNDTVTYTEAQKSVICNTLDNCIWDNSTKDCKSYPYCSSVDTIEEISKRKVICNLKTNCNIDEDDKCIDKADSEELCDKFTNTKKCRELTGCTLNNNDNNPSSCAPNCDIKLLTFLSIQNKNKMCVPKTQTCFDLTDEDTCESYPNIRYCRWDNPKCVDRIKNTTPLFTLPTSI